MPAKTSLFSNKADPIFDFGTAPRNTLSYSPHGRILCVGGFGNLAGELDFWDMQKKVKLTSVSCPNCTYLSWSPDGRYLLTSTLSPRLRVDNGWKLWHYRGVCIASHQVKELFQVVWRPQLVSTSPESWIRRELSPAPAGMSPVVKPKSAGGAYRPPSARSGARSTPGATFVTPPTPPPTSNSSRGGRGGKSNPRTNGRPNSEGGLLVDRVPLNEEMLQPGHLEKRVTTLIKKLKQIQSLKQKMVSGAKLDAAQVRKVSSESQVRSELRVLNVDDSAL
jgi:translation initiation factor 2A